MKNFNTRKSISYVAFSVILLTLSHFAFGQTLTTDKGDYPPGDTVYIAGSGFLSDETVTMQVLHVAGTGGDNDSSEAHEPWNTIADDNGNISTIWVIPFDEDEGNSSLVASAFGQSSGDSAEVFFTDAACPPITITANPTSVQTCAGQSVSFSVSATTLAPGALTYKWRKNSVNITGATNSAFSIASVSASDAGNYDVVVTNSCGSSKTSTIATITVNNVDGGQVATNQTITIGGDPSAFQSIVDGSGSGTITYQWQQSSDNVNWTNISGATSATYDQGALNQDIYFRRVTTSTFGSLSCPAYSNVVIVVVDNVSAGTISGNQIISYGHIPLPLGNITSATGDGTISYQWEYSTDGSVWTDISGATGTSYAPMALTETTYFRRVATSSLSGVESEDISNVSTIDVIPCSTSTSAFDASACNSYSLPWGGSVTVSGNYPYTYSTMYGCDSVVTANVTIYNSAASSFNASACNSYTLPWGDAVNASGNYSHTYSTSHGCDSVVTANVTIYNSAASSFSASACNSYTLPWGDAVNASGNYSHTYSTSHGCDSVVTAHVTINSNPSVSITGNNSICSGSNTTFNAGLGYDSYSWSTGATTQSITVSTAGTYTVTVTNSNGCTGSTTRSLTLNSTPAAPTVTVVNNCNGTSTLTASGVTGALAWSNGATSNPLTVSAAGTYTVTQTVNGCTSPASGTATAAPKTAPAAPVLTVVNNCDGTSTLTASGFTGTLTWSNGGSSNPKVVTTAGSYTVTQTVNGCVSPASASVTAAPKSPPSCGITSSGSCALGGAQNTYNAPAGLDSYSWSVSGCGSSISGSRNASSVKINSSNTNGSYTLTLTVTDNGCSSTCTKTVTVKQSKDICQYSCLYTTGYGYHPTCTKSAVCGNFKVYDLNTCGAPSGHQNDYCNTWNSTSGQLDYCQVSAPVLVNYGGGPCYRYTITVPANQKCLILGQSTVPSSYYQGGSCTVYTANTVNNGCDNIDPCTNNTLKFNCVIKDYSNKCSEGSTNVQYGSELLIISPAALEFTDSTENLPVVYESVDGIWSAEVSPTPPDGFYAIPDTSLSTTVTDSVVDAVQFTIVDTGSVWTYTELKHKLHHNGADRITYSNPLMVNMRTNKLTGINLYPNPTAGNIIINLPQFEGKARIFIHDINGQKVMEQNIKIVDGASFSMDVSKLAAGIYLISVENDEGRVSSKFIKEIQ